MEKVRRVWFELELTGDRATGKSTALHNVIIPALVKAGYTCAWKEGDPDRHVVRVTAPLTEKQREGK